MNIIRELDISGFQCSLLINKRDKMKTFWGGTVFSLFFALSAVFFYFEFVEFLEGKHFSLNNTRKNIQYPNYIKLKQRNFQISAAIFNSQNRVTPALWEYLDVKFSFETSDKTFPFSEKALPEESCTQSNLNYLPEESANTIREQYNLAYFKCFDLSSVELGGRFFEGLYSELRINVQIKEEKMNKEDLNTIKLLLSRNKYTFYLFYPEDFFDEGSSEGTKAFMNELSLGLNFDFYTKKYLLLQDFYVLDDKNWFFNDETLKVLLKTDAVWSIEYQVDRAHVGGVLAEILVKSSFSESKLERKYQKIPEFLANSTVIISHIFSLLGFSIRTINGKIFENRVKAELKRQSTPSKKASSPKKELNFELSSLLEVVPVALNLVKAEYVFDYLFGGKLKEAQTEAVDRFLSNRASAAESIVTT